MGKKLGLFKKYCFEYIHWCDDWNNNTIYTEKNIQQFCQLVESYGLRCLDVHGAATPIIRIDAEEESMLNKYIQLLENRIKFCAALGGDAVVIHPLSNKDINRSFNWRLNQSLYVFDRVKSLCKELDIVLAVENCHLDDEKALSFYFKRYPPEFVSFCFDSGHANVNKNLNQLIKFGNRLRALHLHDNKGEKDDHQPPFWGTINWNNVMSWIKNIGYKKPLCFEVEHDSKLFSGNMDEYMRYTIYSIKRVLSLL